jgi:4-amino-4-deoxy-L-arabinose transferase-like glycosyltransferase
MSCSPTPLRRFHHWLFVGILAGYLLVAGLFAVFTPPWQAPDEPAHYNYVAQVARNGCCPVIELGDWNSPYLEQLKTAHFAPDLLGNLSRVQYEDHQPPLYYLLQAPVFKVTGGSLVAMRLVSVLLGAGIVACAYWLGLVLLPDRPLVALGAAALVAFLPQHVAILASVNNDALGNLVIAATLLALVAYLKGRDIKEWQLGLLVGVGLLTKVSTLFLGGIVGLAILLKWWDGRNEPDIGTRYKALFRRLALFAVPALMMGGLWWAHSISVYGFPDVFGLRQHDRVVADQTRTADLIAQIGWEAYLSRAVQTTFNSFWGQFGWMALPMPEWVYRIIAGLLLLSVSGLLVKSVSLRGIPSSNSTQRGSWFILILTMALAVLAYIYYNTVFLQLQGRYLFTGLLPFALVLALGVDNWVTKLITHRAFVCLTVLPFVLFAVLDAYLLWRVIVPGLRP